MLFSILGPVEVRGDRGPCEPASPMSRQVLSLLLVHANQVVPLESLVEELWDDTPPKLARKTVQTYIYHVRKALREGAGADRGCRPSHAVTGSGSARDSWTCGASRNSAPGAGPH